MAQTDVFDHHADAYEAWFERHPQAYASELQAISALFPTDGVCVEVGVGTGRFAAPLGIRLGVEPSSEMRRRAEARGVEVLDGTAEALPLPDASVDCVLMVTTLCFLDDVEQALREVRRVLHPGGRFFVGFIDRESRLGRQYEQHKSESLFYRHAHFHSADEVEQALRQAGFTALEFRQTLFGDPGAMQQPDPVLEGHGRGAFVVAKGERKMSDPAG